MWLIVGTSPQLPKGHMFYGDYTVEQNQLIFQNSIKLHIERGTEVLAAITNLVCEHLSTPKPNLLCACDYGDGEGSKKAYAHLVEHVKELKPQGITFHYLFPDVDWHNKILISLEELDPKPILIADAGFMYVAKMSGYADQYDLFTPDVGEMSFLADELAPHPFYTRGFLLQDDANVETLLQRTNEHKNAPPNLIIKGNTDFIVHNKEVVAKVNEPSVATMEAIGGTGDMVTGLVTGLLMAGYSMQEACVMATKTNRIIAKLANPSPATSVSELLSFLQPALDIVLDEGLENYTSSV